MTCAVPRHALSLYPRRPSRTPKRTHAAGVSDQVLTYVPEANTVYSLAGSLITVVLHDSIDDSHDRETARTPATSVAYLPSTTPSTCLILSDSIWGRVLDPLMKGSQPVKHRHVVTMAIRQERRSSIDSGSHFDHTFLPLTARSSNTDSTI